MHRGVRQHDTMHGYTAWGDLTVPEHNFPERQEVFAADAVEHAPPRDGEPRDADEEDVCQDEARPAYNHDCAVGCKSGWSLFGWEKVSGYLHLKRRWVRARMGGARRQILSNVHAG